MYIVMVNTHIDQVSHFGGILSWGDFVPTLILLSLYVSHYGKHFFHDFFGVGGFCPNEKSTLSYVYHYRKHSYISSFVFWGILSWGDFVPTTTLPYSMYSITFNIHIQQHMVWEDFVPGGFYPVTDLVLCFSAPLLLPIKICDFRRFCPREDFVPTLYPLCMCTI